MKNIKYISLIALILPFSLLAQGAPPATPIDGGLSILLAGGAAYGIKNVMQKKK